MHLTKELANEHPQAGLRNIHITLPTAWPLAKVYGDSDLLQLAFYNLVENAIKYSDPGDEIDIRASDNNSVVTIEIADTGLGIAIDEVTQACDELFRGHNSRDRAGTGIGDPW